MIRTVMRAKESESDNCNNEMPMSIGQYHHHRHFRLKVMERPRVLLPVPKTVLANQPNVNMATVSTSLSNDVYAYVSTSQGHQMYHHWRY